MSKVRQDCACSHHLMRHMKRGERGPCKKCECVAFVLCEAAVIAIRQRTAWLRRPLPRPLPIAISDAYREERRGEEVADLDQQMRRQRQVYQ